MCSIIITSDTHSDVNLVENEKVIILVQERPSLYMMNNPIHHKYGNRIKSPRQNPPGKNPPDKIPSSQYPPDKIPRHKILT